MRPGDGAWGARTTLQSRGEDGKEKGGKRPLRACVGVMVVMSSSDSFLRMVVFPALSRPSTRIRAWCNTRETRKKLD